MNIENHLKPFLQIWEEVFSGRLDIESQVVEHLSTKEIYRMAEPGGINKSGPIAVEHLSRCPVCLKEWAAWRRAVSDTEDVEDEESLIMAYGMLEAAATTHPKEPISVRSSCNNFILGLLPQMDNPDKFMITIEAVAPDAISLEGRKVTVRDHKGLLLIEGRLRHGRLARLSENIDDIDLTTWTVVIENKKATP